MELDPWFGEPAEYWWFGGEELCKSRFDLLYQLLIDARKESNKQRANLCFIALQTMGIYSLPFAIKALQNGDDDMCRLVQDIVLELDQKNKDEILEWWQLNQKKYTLPKQDKQMIDKIIVYPDMTWEKKLDFIYAHWHKRHVLPKDIPTEYNLKYKCVIELAQLIGYENTPQFRFLVDLGEEALPHLFLKLKDEETRFTLPVIEKIMNRKLSDEEIEQKIKEAELLLNPPEPIAMRSWTSKGGHFSIEAKFVSANDKTVTLEKANGTTISVELSKLSEVDQEYVKSQVIATENATE